MQPRCEVGINVLESGTEIGDVVAQSCVPFAQRTIFGHPAIHQRRHHGTRVARLQSRVDLKRCHLKVA